jgi:hypothetical protein
MFFWFGHRWFSISEIIAGENFHPALRASARYVHDSLSSDLQFMALVVNLTPLSMYCESSFLLVYRVIVRRLHCCRDIWQRQAWQKLVREVRSGGSTESIAETAKQLVSLSAVPSEV